MSTRWCPTPQQLMILEDMYRAGIHTPKASQIQQITTYLSFFGKIEGKNVFYWFQNHKARERQKLRRRFMSKQLEHLPHQEKVAANNAGSLFLQPHQHFLHHQELSRVVNLLCKVEAPNYEETKQPVTTGGENHELLMLEICPTSSSRPLQTLELFPTNSTGLKEQKPMTDNTVTSTTASICSKTTV